MAWMTMETDVSRGDEGGWEERTERCGNTKMVEAYTTEGERGDSRKVRRRGAGPRGEGKGSRGGRETTGSEAGG